MPASVPGSRNIAMDTRSLVKGREGAWEGRAGAWGVARLACSLMFGV